MANPEHLAKLKEGVAEWNQWRRLNPVVRPDLEKANLGYADLTHADLTHADLTFAELAFANLTDAKLFGADLGGADLTGADLSTADLTSADFSTAYPPWPPGADPIPADLTDANLSGANLIGANLSDTDLTRADLRKASLFGANFSNANIGASKLERSEVGSTVFGACDLSEVGGLDLVQHYGPSTIGIDTIYLSHGKIAEVFLRGAGVPENFIEYMNSLVGQVLEFYSCFISYSTKDQDFAVRLHADLQAKGVRCWFAPHDMESGKKVHEQIDQAIRLHERLLLILSPDSINSEWVKTEIKKARNREIKEKRRVLFPIGLISFEELKEWEYPDPDTGMDIALEIRGYYIPDFTKWKEDHDLYQNEFDKLLKSLQSKGETGLPAVG